MSAYLKTTIYRTTDEAVQEKRRRHYAVRHFIAGLLTLMAANITVMGTLFAVRVERFLPFESPTALTMIISGITLFCLSMRFLNEAWYCGVSEMLDEWFD